MRFASRTGYKVTILLLVVSLLAVGFDADPALANTQTKTVEFPESTEQNRTQTITIPGLIRVKNVSVDTGRVNYTVNGDEITLTVSGGTPSRTDTPSKVVNEKRGPQDSPNFPSSISYDDGEYSGTLYKDGEAYEDGTRLDRKTVTVSYGRQSSTSFPVTYEYNVNGYTGTLYKDGGYYRDGTRYSYKYVTRTRGPQESTSFPDRIYVSEGGYSGYISKSGSYYLSRTEERPDSKFIGEYLPIDGKFVCDKNDARCIEEAETYGVTRPPLYIVIGSNWIGLEEYEGYSGWLYNTRCNCRWYELSYDRSKIRYVGDIVFEGYVYGTKTVYLYSQDYAGSISKAEGPLYNQDYTGTVSKTIQQYSQNYTGTVTAPTIRYYSYVVTIEYEANGIENAEVLHVDEFVDRLGVPAEPGVFYAGEAFHLKTTTIGSAEEVRVISPFDVGPETVQLQKEQGETWEAIFYHKDFQKLQEGEYTFRFEALFGDQQVRTKDVTIQIKGSVKPMIHLTY